LAAAGTGALGGVDGGVDGGQDQGEDQADKAVGAHREKFMG